MRRPSARDDEDGAGRITLGFLLVGLGLILVTEILLIDSDSDQLRISVRLLFLAVMGMVLLVLLRRELRRRRLAEERLEHAQRLEALGRLAGGLAHDFNNLLTVINGFTDVVMRRLPEDDPSRADLDAVRRAGEQAGSLVDQLLTLSRHRVVRPELVDPNQCVRELTSVLHRILGSDIELDVRTVPVGRVLIDPSQLCQVLLNLVVNARDAMTDGGRVSIATQVGAFGDGQRAVVLTVSDNGPGMDAETAKRCFDPFFSTRPTGEGTGLGLATVHAVVTQAGGEATVATAPGKGATFTFRFPQASLPVVDAPPVTGRAEEDEPVVLLVDDEDAVRTFAGSVLRSEGYDVLDAASGVEALALIDEHGCPDLLITDVVMPGMGGVELARRVKERSPATAVLFISGYVDDPELRASVGPDRPLLSKPFLAGKLVAEVDRLLPAAQGSNR
jgi:signal transduction histidine kinase